MLESVGRRSRMETILIGLNCLLIIQRSKQKYSMEGNQPERCECEEHLKKQLEQIMISLTQEIQQFQSFYEDQIQNLHEEISVKDEKLSELEEQLANIKSKFYSVSAELNQKNYTINRLNKTIHSLQQKFKQSIHHYIQQFDFSFHEPNTSSDGPKDHPKNIKRINISQYFLKTTEKSKQTTRCDYDLSSNGSTFSTLNQGTKTHFWKPSLHSLHSLDRVKSTDHQHFLQGRNELRERGDSGESGIRKYQFGKRVQKDQEMSTVKNRKWKNVSALSEMYRRDDENILPY